MTAPAEYSATTAIGEVTVTGHAENQEITHPAPLMLSSPQDTTQQLHPPE